ncbi:SWA2 [Candida metapsilosis]|uniref:SWA2 n=1 Tax=Candida metapsilosis TaxID=273372 RepID=A0A8H7ZDV4_9ASCO|nr:SWA2 [Candida metapsilosis]
MPPKKDAFADLFQSASSSRSNGAVNARLDKLSLTERQKLEQQQQHSQSTASLNSSWSNLDILSPQSTQGSRSNNGSHGLNSRLSNSGSAFGSVSSTPKATAEDDDPFAIFNTPSNGGSNNNTAKPVSSQAGAAKPVSTQASAAKPQEMSLLDDDFTDLFPEQQQKPQKQSVEQLVKPPRPEVIRTGSNVSSSSRVNRSSASTPKPSTTASATSSKDHTIAELIDIGFTIDDANDAVAHSGTDLQKCVNYIMNKSISQSQSRSSSRKANSSNLDDYEEYEDYEDSGVLGKRPDSINFNELGNNLFQKANTFINFSKKKVLENIEQLNNGRSSSPFDFGLGRSGSSNGSSNANLPEWMRNQAKYKSQAYEKKYGGEDYGEDEDNINQEEIDRFMRQQREKERQRMRQRFDNEGSKGSGSDSRSGSNRNSVDRSRRESASPSFTAHKSSSKESSPAPPRPPRPAVKKVASDVGSQGRESPKKVEEVASKGKEKEKQEEADLLGISTPSSAQGVHSYGFVSSSTSNLRDCTPLNQFIETDYTTLKSKATESFKNGDYATALESYSKCLDILPPKHEFRVVVNSNLALTNKLQGHLKQSLDNVEQALELMQLEECNTTIEGDGGQLAGKSVKYWYLKVVIVKAEVLELLEKYELALESYNLLVQKLGCVDKKVMDGKRRVDRIVNPDNYKVKPKPQQNPTAKTSTKKATTTSTTPTVKKASSSTEVELDPLVVDEINNSISKWAHEKNNDLRQMLINLQVLIPIGSININERLLSLSLNDLVLPKQVKLNYMKVISSIHPDKLASQLSRQSTKDKRIQLVCNGLFIILNERWEVFRKEENI